MDCSMPGSSVLYYLLEFAQIHVRWVSDVIQPSHPLSSPSLPFPSIRVFSSESVLPIRWPKYWSFSFSISPSNDYSGLISFRMDWLDLLVVQGSLKSLLQHHSSKASILRCSAFLIVQLSHPYMTTGKTIALTRWTFVGKVTSLLFIMLSRLVITFLPRSKHLLISWLLSPSAVILEPQKIKSAAVSTVSLSICHEVMAPKQIDYILCSQRWRSSIQSGKTRPGADYGSDHELLITKFRLELKKVGKTTRPFRYDLNQTPNS